MVFLIRNKNGHRIYFTIETTTLLHNLLFNITFSLSNAIYCASGGTFLYSHVVIVAVARGVRQGLSKKIIGSNRCVLQ